MGRLDEHQIAVLRAAYTRLKSIRAAATECGVAKSTAERYLKGIVSGQKRVVAPSRDHHVALLESALTDAALALGRAQTVLAIIRNE